MLSTMLVTKCNIVFIVCNIQCIIIDTCHNIMNNVCDFDGVCIKCMYYVILNT